MPSPSRPDTQPLIPIEPSRTPGLIFPWVRRHGIALAASGLAAAGFAWILHAGAFPIVPGPEAWTRVRWWTAPVYFLIWALTQLFRCSRWYLLLLPVHAVSLGSTLRVALIGYGAQVVLPFRLGEAVRPALIRKAAGVPLGAATGTVAAERLIDGLFLSGLLVAALLSSHPISPLPDHIGALPVPASLVPTAAWSGAIGFGALSAAMVMFYVTREWARRLTLWVLSPLSKTFAIRVAQVAESLASGLRFLAVPRVALPFLGLTAVYWVITVLGIWFLLWGAGIESPTVLEAAVTLGVMCLGVVVPNAPGYFGSFQMSGYAALVMFYTLPEVQSAGAAFVFLLYGLQMSVTLLLAIIAFFLERASLSDVLHHDG